MCPDPQVGNCWFKPYKIELGEMSIRQQVCIEIQLTLLYDNVTSVGRFRQLNRAACLGGSNVTDFLGGGSLQASQGPFDGPWAPLCGTTSHSVELEADSLSLVNNV